MEPILVALSNQAPSTSTPLPFGRNLNPVTRQFHNEFASNTSTAFMAVSENVYVSAEPITINERKFARPQFAWSSWDVQNPFFSSLTSLPIEVFGLSGLANEITFPNINQIEINQNVQPEIETLVDDLITLNPIARKSLRMKFSNKRRGSINLFGDILEDPYER